MSIYYLLFRADFGQLVGGSNDLLSAPGVVVAEVLRDDGAGADEVVVLVEQKAGPGELARTRLPVFPTLGLTPLPGAALLAARRDLLRAVLPPESLRGGLSLGRANASPPED